MERPKIYPPSLEHVPDHAEASNRRSDASRPPMALGQQRPTLAWVDLRAIVDEVCAQFETQATAQGIETTLDVPKQLGMLADADMLRRAVSHLVANALECMTGGGRLVITSFHGAGGLELEVADSGPGLSDDALHRAFDPYFTTKRNNAGLGLAHVRRIAQLHGGDVVAANCPEGGAAFTLRFPPRAQQRAA